MNKQPLTRRSFLIGAACLCTAAATQACAVNQSFVRAEIHANRARVPLEQLSLENSTLVYVEPLAATVALDWLSDDTPDAGRWRAMLLVCTHRGCNVAPSRGGYLCPCHDSRFDAEGTVLVGPAVDPLPELFCVVEEDALYVTMPI